MPGFVTGKFQYKATTLTGHSDHKPQSFEIAVACKSPLQFTLRPEKPSDLRAKKWGISAEYQFGIPEIDRQLYLVCDNKNVGDALAKDPEVLLKICGLLNQEAIKNSNLGQSAVGKWSLSGTHITELECINEHLFLKYVSPPDSPGFHDKFAAVIVPNLAEISQRISDIGLSPLSKFNDPFAIKASVILSFVTASALVAYFEFYHRFLVSATKIIEPFSLLKLTLPLGIATVLILLALTKFLLGRGSRSHLVLLDVLLIGGLAFMVNSYVLVHDINTEFDRAPNVTRIAAIVNKQEIRRRKSPTTHKLHLAATPDGDLPNSIVVDSRFYRDAAIGDTLIAKIKPGWLGYAWIESLEIEKAIETK